MKKTISLLLALCFLAITAVPVFAVQSPRVIEPQRYTCISSPRVSYSEDNSTHTCTGRVRVRSGATTTMEVYLQISYDKGVSFEDYYLLESKQFTGTGAFTLRGTRKETSKVNIYRAALYVSVYDANGKLIDSAEAYSG